MEEREILTWELFGTAARDLAQHAVDDGYGPEIILSIARRGLIPANAVMLYAPRDDGELDVVAGLVEASYTFASTAPHQG